MGFQQRVGAKIWCSLPLWGCSLISFAILSAVVANAAVTPTTNCYALDGENRLYDLTDVYGREFEKEAGGKTYKLRFCKDFQEISQDLGYISFGSYEAGITGDYTSVETGFKHEYRHGDLNRCEHQGSEFHGRQTEVSIICDKRCPSGATCTDSFGCICSVTFDDSQHPCAASVVVAIPCPKPGPRVINGFTVGFGPRGKEVVSNGFTQWGFENGQHLDYSFDTSQTRVFLYFSAPRKIAEAVGKPKLTADPSKGLEVQLTGSAASGKALPTTLSPSLLEVYWRCETQNMFTVNVTVPVTGYDSVVFSLLKLCDSMQAKQANASSGWATFGVLSCIFFVMTSMCCCAGFLYGTRVENKHGLEAVPGIGVISSCLDAVSRSASDYQRADEGASIIGDYSSRGNSNTNSGDGLRSADGRYGSVR